MYKITHIYIWPFNLLHISSSTDFTILIYIFIPIQKLAQIIDKTDDYSFFVISPWWIESG